MDKSEVPQKNNTSNCLYLKYSRIMTAVMLILVGLLSQLTTGNVAANRSGKKVYVIPVAGDVEPALNAYIERALRDVGNDPQALYVFEMDTFGGRVDSALKIVDTLLNKPKGATVAFVVDKAISAGALIALACNELVMRPGTTIGDCAPISFSSEGPKMLGEKFQSPLRAKFRTLAKRNGFPETLAESMVTKEMVVYQVEFPDRTVYMDSLEFNDLSPEKQKQVVSKKTVVAEGELLTMDDTEAREYGFSSMSVPSVEEMLARKGISDYQIIRMEESWSETLGRLISKIAPILMMIGLAALYAELKAPGFGLPGIVGIICLGLVFFNQYLVGLADYTELLFILIGIGLLGVEVFVLPGFGIAGISGFAFIAIGLILSFQDFVLPDPKHPWEMKLLIANITHVLGAFVVAVITGLAFMRYVFPRLGTAIDGPYLDTTLAGSKFDSEDVKELKEGDTGVAVTLLRPAGKIKIAGEVYDALTEGEYINKGETVRISGIRGNRVFVTRGDE